MRLIPVLKEGKAVHKELRSRMNIIKQTVKKVGKWTEVIIRGYCSHYTDKQ